LIFNFCLKASLPGFFLFPIREVILDTSLTATCSNDGPRGLQTRDVHSDK
jgi:hypothetical protein